MLFVIQHGQGEELFCNSNNVDIVFVASGTKWQMHYQQHRWLVTYLEKVGYLPTLNKSL